jgi:NADP-dependent 3-hydroxy acid dehydrogenase YdfG
MPGIDESKCVLVTGATAGIGGALARAIANLPSRPRVIAAGRREDRLQKLAKEKLTTVQVDLDTDRDSLRKFVADLLQKYSDVCNPSVLDTTLPSFAPARYCGALCGYTT